MHTCLIKFQQRKSYSVLTFFNLLEMVGTDEFGVELGTYYIDELVDGFEIIFFYEDTYKLFDIDLMDGYFDYNFNWQDGETFNP